MQLVVADGECGDAVRACGSGQDALRGYFGDGAPVAPPVCYERADRESRVVFGFAIHRLPGFCPQLFRIGFSDSFGNFGGSYLPRVASVGCGHGNDLVGCSAVDIKRAVFLLHEDEVPGEDHGYALFVPDPDVLQLAVGDVGLCADQCVGFGFEGLSG
ncbi:MAG: hypothetical protein ACI3Z7_01475 [Candidatus Aphodosoma sp.]